MTKGKRAIEGESSLRVEVVRSKRRQKTVGAKWVGEAIEIRAPLAMTDAELEPIRQKLVERLVARRDRDRARTDIDLNQRADKLNREYFGGKLKVASIEFVSNQNGRFGSCTPTNRTIRLSHKLARYPAWVLDYVIVHELAHLIHPNHSKAFWDAVYRYPLTERARGFLIAVALAEDDVCVE